MEKTLEVYYEHEHGDDPVFVSDPDELDALVDRVRDEYRDKWPVLLEVTHVGDYEHLLNVGIRGDVGVLFYSGKDFPGRNYSKSEDTGHIEELTYYYMRNNREYPSNAEIPLSLVKLAVRWFLEDGPKRPVGVEWQEAE